MATKKKDAPVEVIKNKSYFTNRKTGEVVKVVGYDEATKKYSVKRADGSKSDWAKGYLNLAHLPGDVKIEDAEKPKKKEKKAPKITKLVYIGQQLTKGIKLDSLVDKVGEKFPEGSTKENPQLVKKYAKVGVALGHGTLEKGKYTPVE